MIHTNRFKILIAGFCFRLIFSSVTPAQTLEDLQRDFAELRFGAFIHFSIMTFTGDPWATPHQDISQFNPSELDCGQWADAFKSAGMKFGILTTKHHDGFCLWNSAYTENDVAETPWKNGQGDVIKEYTDSFRSRGLIPMLYYSVWDNTAGIGNGTITADHLAVIKGQITELLTQYGEIAAMFFDGWAWKTGHKSVSYEEIRALIKSLQPGCLIIENEHLGLLFNTDLIHYESGTTAPEDNTKPSMASRLINYSGGNDWFWAPGVTTSSLMSVDEIVNTNLQYLEPLWCNFVLNCPPNNKGKLDEHIVNRLKEVGEVWQPDLSRPLLPPQPPQMNQPYTAVSATATSGTAGYVIDGFNDRFYYSVWESDKSLPQSVTIDLGYNRPVDIIYYVPKFKPTLTPVKEGSIQSYRICESVDNITYNMVAEGSWEGNTEMKVAAFPVVTTRYMKLEALSAVNSFAAATEFMAGLSCPPSAISPYFYINDGEQQEGLNVICNTDDKVILSPQSLNDTGWAWSGPDEFMANLREIILQKIRADQFGQYRVIYTNACNSKSSLIFNVLSADRVNIKNQHGISPVMKIFPNPLEGHVFHIEPYDHYYPYGNITLCDLQGRMLSLRATGSNSFFIESSLTPGLYFLQISNHQSVITEKILIGKDDVN